METPVNLFAKSLPALAAITLAALTSVAAQAQEKVLRIAMTSLRKLSSSRGAASTSRRTVSNLAPVVASPAQKRARVSAWCSHIHADSSW